MNKRLLQRSGTPWFEFLFGVVSSSLSKTNSEEVFLLIKKNQNNLEVSDV